MWIGSCEATTSFKAFFDTTSCRGYNINESFDRDNLIMFRLSEDEDG
jgi:hypothetical protein